MGTVVSLPASLPLSTPLGQSEGCRGHDLGLPLSGTLYHKLPEKKLKTANDTPRTIREWKYGS